MSYREYGATLSKLQVNFCQSVHFKHLNKESASTSNTRSILFVMRHMYIEPFNAKLSAMLRQTNFFFFEYSISAVASVGYVTSRLDETRRGRRNRSEYYSAANFCQMSWQRHTGDSLIRPPISSHIVTTATTMTTTGWGGGDA